jgi:8-oxo-dGTP diphosphatase
MKQVHVAVGVIERDERIFVCRRADDAHQGGLWEFPGGKIEQDETPVEALGRELHEEVDIEVLNSVHLIDITHEYTDKAVTLHVYRVTDFSGVARGKEGQPNEWRAISELDYADFPAANKAIIDALQAV